MNHMNGILHEVHAFRTVAVSPRSGRDEDLGVKAGRNLIRLSESTAVSFRLLPTPFARAPRGSQRSPDPGMPPKGLVSGAGLSPASGRRGRVRRALGASRRAPEYGRPPLPGRRREAYPDASFGAVRRPDRRRIRPAGPLRFRD